MVAGAEVPVVWQGRRVRAFVPELLSERDLALSPGALAATAAASAQVALGAASMPEDHEPLARLLLRAEGVASSYLEGLTAPLPDVVLAEAGGQPGTTAGWVAANSAALGAAVADAHERALDVDLMCAWHALLMAGSPLLGRHVGAVRREQGWIGGTSPLDAALVTPPPDHLPALLADLCDYANRDDVDPIAQAAVVHAQFEVCHPFADGNGRVGRVAADAPAGAGDAAAGEHPDGRGARRLPVGPDALPCREPRHVGPLVRGGRDRSRAAPAGPRTGGGAASRPVAGAARGATGANAAA